jgi:hypothetical protein
MEPGGVPQEVLDKTVNVPQNIAHFGSVAYKPYVDNQPVGAKLKEAFQYFLSTPEGQNIVAQHGNRPAPNPEQRAAMFKTLTANMPWSFDRAQPPAQGSAPQRQEPEGGPGMGQAAQIPNYDHHGTYARASQLAQLFGVPAFIFQGKLYRPGDTQAPVSAAPQGAPQMRPPGGMPQEVGPRQAPPMDRRPEPAPTPVALPKPASQAEPMSMFGQGGGRN